MKEKCSNPPILTVNYATNPEWHKEVLKLTGGVGVDIVVENSGSGIFGEAHEMYSTWWYH